MSYDQHWTRFIRSWRAIGEAANEQRLNSTAYLLSLVERHPLPWIIDRDWTWEVIAKDGTVVTKKQSYAEALDFVQRAEAL